MKNRIEGALNFLIYWSIIIFPFSISISNGFMNTFMGLIVVAYLLKKIIRKECLFPGTNINIPLLALFLMTVFSLSYSAYPKDTVKGGVLRLLQYIIMLFALIEELRDKKHIWRIIFAILAGLVLVSIDAVWQVGTGKDFMRGHAPIINIGLARATASFSDANIFGVYISAIAPLFFGLAIYYFKGWKKALFGVFSLLGLTGITLTYSRPTLLGTYLALLFLSIARRSKWLITFLIVFILIAPFLLPKSVKQFAKEVNYNPIRFMCNDDRIAIFRNSVKMIKASPIIGHGANTFMKNYKQYKENPEYLRIVTADFLYAHDNFLQMAGEIGLVGLGIFLWLLYELFKGCAYIYRQLKDYQFKIIFLSLVACILAFLVNGLTESSLYSSHVTPIFWYLIGFSFAFKKFIAPDEKSN
ncbi:MAG: O-antigen ligase family protein [Candidatus Omnitrophica bacterium]|nr:O-antigen ligase family protein [Candidatus Omnitrophota bacterium]